MYSPELLGKWYTRSNRVYAIDFGASSSNIASGSNMTYSEETTRQHYYCYCRGSEETGDMIGCDNDECKIEWFHLACLKIKTVPNGKWYCPDCRKLSKFLRQNKKRKI